MGRMWESRTPSNGANMPTLKPKRTLVFSSSDTQRALEAALSDRCEMHRTSMSYEIEQILIDTLIPPAGSEAERAMMRIYYGQSTVKEELAQAFCDAAAGDGYHARHGDMRPLVELAARQSVGLTLDLATRHGSAMPVYHARECWDAVVRVMRGAAKDDGLVGIDAKAAEALLGRLGDESAHPEAKAYFDVILRNWELLGDYTYTYRSLMDVVDMTVGWPEDARSREGLKAALVAIESAREGGE